MLRRLRRGWCSGSAEFRQKLLERIAGKGGVDAQIGRKHDELEAERILAKGRQVLGIGRSNLKRIAKGAPEKIALAVRIRRRTLRGNRSIAEKLMMECPNRVSRYCSEAERTSRRKGLMKRLEPMLGRDELAQKP